MTLEFNVPTNGEEKNIFLIMEYSIRYDELSSNVCTTEFNAVIGVIIVISIAVIERKNITFV